MAVNDPTLISLQPLGAGDLIDRTIRFYRQNVGTFLLIAAPPVLIGTAVSVIWTLIGRGLFDPDGTAISAERTFYAFFSALGTMIIWLAEFVSMLVVMGGASRNFVRHILFGEKVTFKETYKNVRSRLGGLTGASLMIVSILGLLWPMLFYFSMIGITMIIMLVVFLLSSIKILATLVSIALALAGIWAMLWVFFWVASKFAYIPQIMMVEGLGVGSAMSRSASMASGKISRLMALFIFTFVATISALAMLYVPLGWLAWTLGIETGFGGQSIMPAWVEIASGSVWQVANILLMPVLMIGLCILYVDERVRGEGYDIELMAARRLGDIPSVPSDYLNPLNPALAAETFVPATPRPHTTMAPTRNSSSILGLDQ